MHAKSRRMDGIGRSGSSRVTCVSGSQLATIFLLLALATGCASGTKQPEDTSTPAPTTSGGDTVKINNVVNNIDVGNHHETNVNQIEHSGASNILNSLFAGAKHGSKGSESMDSHQSAPLSPRPGVGVDPYAYKALPAADHSAPLGNFKATSRAAPITRQDSGASSASFESAASSFVPGPGNPKVAVAGRFGRSGRSSSPHGRLYKSGRRSARWSAHHESQFERTRFAINDRLDRVKDLLYFRPKILDDLTSMDETALTAAERHFRRLVLCLAEEESCDSNGSRSDGGSDHDEEESGDQRQLVRDFKRHLATRSRSKSRSEERPARPGIRQFNIGPYTVLADAKPTQSQRRSSRARSASPTGSRASSSPRRAN